MPPRSTTALGTLLPLVWIETRRLCRGWRWRGFLVLCLAACWWFSRLPQFGPGTAIWFPGGPIGVHLFAGVLALVAGVFGVDAIAILDRVRYQRMVEARLTTPWPFVLSRWLATILSLLPIAMLVTFFASIGAWRVGLDVLWQPPLVYLGMVLLPLLMAGASVGIFFRSLLRADLAALGATMLTLGPVLFFRLQIAPPSDVFFQSSLHLGVLIPLRVLGLDALRVVAVSVPFLSLAMLLLPRVRLRTPLAGGRISKIPSIRSGYLFLQSRWTNWPLGAMALPILVGLLSVPILLPLMRERPLPLAAVDWSQLREPVGTNQGRIPAVRILQREITLSDIPTEPVRLRLTIAAGQERTSVAALSVGRGLVPVKVLSDGVRLLDSSGVTAFFLLELTPSLEAGSIRPVELELAVRPEAQRLWQQGYASKFRTFAALGDWWGEPVRVSFPRQEWARVPSPAPLAMDLPDPAPLGWALGSASTRPEGGRVRLELDVPGNPAPLLAADLVRVQTPAESFPIHWLVTPGNEELAAEFPKIYAYSLRRLHRVFPSREEPIVLYEVPLQASSDLLAVSSSELDRLLSDLPWFGHWRYPTDEEFDAAWSRWHAGIINALVSTSWLEFEDELLLRDGWAAYLHRFAFARGGGRNMQEQLRRDFALVPWSVVRQEFQQVIQQPVAPTGPRGAGASMMGQGQPPAVVPGYPYDLRESVAGAYTGSVFTWKRPPSLPLVPRERIEAFHHMLRGYLGEEGYARLLGELFGPVRSETLTVQRLRETAESIAGEPLDWFFDQWLEEGVLPRLRIVEVQAFLFENPESNALLYRTQATISNAGTGRVPVEVVLTTDADTVKQRVWLDPGERREISIETVDRPNALTLDPEGWILQVAEFDPESKRLKHPQVYIKTIREF